MSTIKEWHQSIQIEYQQEDDLFAKGTIVSVIKKNNKQADILISLNSSAKSQPHTWNEKVTDKELLRDPSLFYAKLPHMANKLKILCAERSQGLLRLSVSSLKQKLSFSDEDPSLYIKPICFLEPLFRRSLDRLEEANEESSFRNYRVEALALYDETSSRAKQMTLAELDGGASQYKQLQFPFRQAQIAAIEAAKSLPLTFIWGPPGTGKTYTLGHIVAQLTTGSNYQKVLAISIANRGIEQMLLKADDAFNELIGKQARKGFFLRTQIPTLPAIAQRNHLTAWSELLKKEQSSSQEIYNEIESLRVKRLAINEEPLKEELSQKVYELREHIDVLTEEYKLKRDQLLADAHAIFCTVNQYSWVPALNSQSYDVVIFEEASMIPSYYLIDIMEMAQAVNPNVKFIISGDPKQLPPIVNRKMHTKGTPWIESPFEFFKANDLNKAPIVDKVNSETKLSVINFLDQQSRMPPDLGRIVSDAFYNSRLSSTRKASQKSFVPNWPNHGLCFVNTQTGDWARWTKLQLKTNPLYSKLPADYDFRNTKQDEAMITIALAKKAVEQGVTKVLHSRQASGSPTTRT